MRLIDTISLVLQCVLLGFLVKLWTKSLARARHPDTEWKMYMGFHACWVYVQVGKIICTIPWRLRHVCGDMPVNLDENLEQ